MIHLTEFPDLEVCQTISKHPEIYPTDKARLKAYCDEALQNGFVKVSYNTKGDVGRFYPTSNNQLTATMMWKRIRASLFHKTDYDIDVVNCHACIMLGLVEELYPEFDVTNLKKYIEYRDEIITNFPLNKSCPFYCKDTEDTITKKDIVKSLFNIVLYGGKPETWVKKYNLLPSEYEIPEFVKDFQEEVSCIAKIIIRSQMMRDNKIKFTKYYTDRYNDEPSTRHIIASILQDYERQIVTKIIDFCVDELKTTVTAYCYDGFQVKKNSFNTEFIWDINNYIYNNNNHFKYCEFIIKDFVEPLDMSKIIECKYFNMNDWNCIGDSYSEKKDYFEKFHFKLFNPPCIVKATDGETCQYIKFNLSNNLYSNLFYINKEYDEKTKTEKINKVKFLTGSLKNVGWLTDPNMRTYEKVNTIPPPLKCSSNVFNDWSEFPILKTPLDNTVDTSIIYKHFDLVSDHDELSKEYLLNWFAHMVQKPGIKSRVALLIHGHQGSGKSTIGEDLMKAVIGPEKMMVTDKIDLLLGRFADTRGKLLVCLNEAKGKDTFNVDNLLKDYITRNKCEVEKKGIDSFTSTAFDRLIFTTNNENPILLEAGDRRWFVVSMDNSMTNNTEYFNKLHEVFDNEIIMRKFYQELMDRNIGKWQPINDRPQSRMAQDMIEMNRDPYTCFVAYMLENYDFVAGIKYNSREFYQKFNEFWAISGRIAEHKPTLTKFATMVKKRKGVITHKTNKGTKYEIIEKVIGSSEK